MTDTDTIEIDGHEYGVEGEALIAERYPDGVQLRVGPVVSGSTAQPIRAWFVRVGPRGGIHLTHHTFSVEEAAEFTLRLRDARRHIRAIDTYRKARWG